MLADTMSLDTTLADITDLYPHREDLRDRYATLPGGWLVATNLNNDYKRKIIGHAAKVAGLTLGKDIVIPF